MKTLKEQFHLDQLSGKGGISVFSYNMATKKIAKMVNRKNLILYSGADILARALSGTPGWFVNTIYIEYQNLASPSDSPVIPAYDRTVPSGIGYYNGLGASPNGDFLRVPLLTNPLLSSSDPTNYNANQIAFFALSEGATGFFGKLFNPSVNSCVIGGALIAAPVVDEQSSDVVFSRTYLTPDKILLQSGYQIGLNWILQFS